MLAGSIFFYAFARPGYVLVPLLITVLTYYTGIAIEQATSEKGKQKIFVAGVCFIIAILVFFKYANFFTSTFTDLFNLISGKQVSNSLLINLAAPLGISYITFQAIGYLIEIKRVDEKAERHFVTWIFPELLSFLLRSLVKGSLRLSRRVCKRFEKFKVFK